ncbi:MAG: NfeD family protein [Pseudoxanthomonas sp.]|nr:NfeD family protein [Pseudoxanthomonas sp.]MDZ3799152.1 NfeD family protein [Xanthomonadales bacterium]TXI30651.1 MAG: NfeD family protein [Ottowia sp.]MBP7465571.1 NfeD family protein [Pseudoxanthomonas sp.]MBP8741452.1 NfeD family protein [Pseudoxanthomonas sp.]
MRAEVIAWAVLALLLIAAETLAPGAFLLWMGLAAAAVFLGVLLVPGIPVLAQAAAFVVLSFVTIQVYRKWFRKAARQSDQPLLNRRAAQAIGRVAELDQAIDRGRGRIRLDDAFWTVEGPDLPAGTPVRVIAVDGMVLKVQEA